MGEMAIQLFIEGAEGSQCEEVESNRLCDTGRLVIMSTRVRTGNARSESWSGFQSKDRLPESGSGMPSLARQGSWGYWEPGTRESEPNSDLRQERPSLSEILFS